MTDKDTLTSLLSRAQQIHNEATADLAAFDAAHELGPTDPGLHSYNKHLTARQVNKRVNGFVNQMRRESEARDRLSKKAKEAAWAVHLAEQEIRNHDAAHTLADLPHARAVRDKEGWHPVIRVNKTTVTVPRGYGLDDKRIPHSHILEVKA